MTRKNQTIQNKIKKDEIGYEFKGLIIYIIFFYMQIGSRYPVLAPLRLEFVIGSIMLLICALKIQRKELDLKENPLNKAILFFLGYLFFSIPIAFIKSRALSGFIEVFKLMAIYYMIIATIDNEKKLKIFMYFYITLLSIIFVEPLLTSHFIYNNYMMRLAGITGYFMHPNQLGMVTATSIPFLFYFIFINNKLIVRLILVILIAAALRAIMLTESRTAMLGVISFFLLFFMFTNKKAKVLVIALLCLIVIWNFMPQKSKDRFLTMTKIEKILSEKRSSFTDEENKKLGSMASRLRIAEHAVGIFGKNPVLGVGLNCYISYSGRMYNEWMPPHNTYLQALAEFGIVGICMFIWVIVYTIKNLYNTKKLLEKLEMKNTDLYKINMAVLMYYLVYLFVSTFGIEIYSNFWWLTGGLSVVLVRITKDFQRKENIENA
jgi:O-antigen ligase